MPARPVVPRIAVALATVKDLPANARTRPDADRRVSRIAARRAIHRLAGEQVTIELHRRAHLPPLAQIRREMSEPEVVALALTHRDGHAAAIAGPAGARVGIDIERLTAAPAEHERYFLTDRERECARGNRGALLWALKEAVWKALQLDDCVGFHELELDMNDTAELRAVSCRGLRYQAVSAISTPWTGYVMATVVLEEIQ